MSNGVFYRYKYNNNWTNWEHVLFNVPDFYKSYSTLAELKAALANA